MRDSYDYLIVGAGLSGLVLAERLRSLGRTSLVVERRNHIGGNCHDRKDSNGLFYHVYGPHYFRTNSHEVRAYLSRFTEWTEAKYRVNVFAGGTYWSFPINLGTFRQFTRNPAASEEDFKAYLARSAVPIASPANSKEAILAAVGSELYEFFYRGYTQKQWGRPAEALDPRRGLGLDSRIRYRAVEHYGAGPRKVHAARHRPVAPAPPGPRPGWPCPWPRRRFPAGRRPWKSGCSPGS